MADFMQAYAAVVEGHEGGYVNDPNDPGGETICGVARNRCVDWAGWETLDAIKDELETTNAAIITSACMNTDGFTDDLLAIYKEQYWDHFYGDQWPDTMQINATEVFDAQVNTGRGVTFLQRACNVLNRNGRDWHDVTVDGAFGPDTWKAVNAAVEKRGPPMVCKLQNIFQAFYYVRLMRAKPKQFAPYVGWFNRVSI